MITTLRLSALTNCSLNKPLKYWYLWRCTATHRGYPKQTLCDNGREFNNETEQKFAEENKIQLKHRSPQTPTTQGLVEHSNRTCKEDIESHYHEQSKQRPWTVVPFYKRSKLHHEHKIPQSHSYDSLLLYKAVFGFKDHTEVKQHPADVEESVLIADQSEF